MIMIPVQFSLFTHILYIRCIKEIRNEITNKRRKEKKETNGFDRSEWWSEEFSFRANHLYIVNGKT